MELLLKFLFQMELGILKHSFQTLYLAFFILRVFLTAFEQDASVTKELYSTLSKLLVRSEFCQQMVDLGGLEVIFKTVDVHMNQQVGLIFTITEGGITHVYRTLFFCEKKSALSNRRFYKFNIRTNQIKLSHTGRKLSEKHVL